MRLNTRFGAALAAAIAVGALMPATADEAAEPMRTSWGVPDLQGNWDFRTVTPFQRPEALADREFLTAEEVAEWEARAALWRMAENRETWSRSPRTPADRPPATRCLIGFNAGPPMVSSAYNNMKLVQGPGYVAILNEMVNDHRIIPTGGGEAAPQHIRFWQGDSVGRRQAGGEDHQLLS